MDDCVSIISQKLNTDVNNFNMDGQFYRWGKNNRYWAVGEELLYQKKVLKYISYGDFKEGVHGKWKSWEKDGEVLGTQTKRRIEKEFNRHAEIAAKEKEESQKLVALKCQEFYENLTADSRTNEYLKRKKIDAAHGAKVLGGVIHIPIIDENQKIWSYQTIDNEGHKKFKYGGRIMGNFAHIGNVFDAKTLYVCEGYSTGCTIYQATQKPVLMAMNSGNLSGAIESIRNINPSCQILILADKDEKLAGQLAAQKCSEKFHGVDYIIPKLKSGSDFNDLHVDEGIDTVKRQIGAYKFKTREKIQLLGYSDDESYFAYFITETNSLKKLTSSEHTLSNLLSMAPSDYWGLRYNCFAKDKEGNETEAIKLDKLIESLFREQKKAGRFNEKKISGYGVHRENGTVAVNLGEKVYYKGKLIDISEANSITNNFYKASALKDLKMDTALTNDEGEYITEIFSKLRFIDPMSCIYLSGWISLAQVFGPLKWRPHIWINGDRGTGKTTVIQVLNKMVPFSEMPMQPTAAGLTQNLGDSSMAIFYDEAETQKGHEKRMDDIMAIIRQCSNADIGKVWRGSSSGVGRQTSVNSIFCLSSIQKRIIDSADISRIMDLEMSSNIPQSEDQRKEVQEGLVRISHWGDKILTRMVKLFPILEENIKEISIGIAGSLKDARQVDQIASLLAGYHALINEGRVSQGFIDEMVEYLNMSENRYAEENNKSSSERCLDEILTTMCDRQMGLTIYDILMDQSKKSDQYGLRLKEGYLYVWPHSPELKRLMKDSGFHDLTILKNHKNCDSNNAQCWMMGGNRKSYRISWLGS